jgi:hypothetical protein
LPIGAGSAFALLAASGVGVLTLAAALPSLLEEDVVDELVWAFMSITEKKNTNESAKDLFMVPPSGLRKLINYCSEHTEALFLPDGEITMWTMGVRAETSLRSTTFKTPAAGGL